MSSTNLKQNKGYFDSVEVQDTSYIEVISLHPKEMQLLQALRNNWRFGEVVIIMRDGLPMRLRRVTEFLDLQ